MKIRVDRDVCVGAGMCALSAPGVFAQAKDDGRVVVLDVRPATASAQEAARRASYLCPSGAITIATEPSDADSAAAHEPAR